LQNILINFKKNYDKIQIMSKYEEKVNLEKFEVYTKLTDYIRSIQRLLSSEFCYYINGKLAIEKLEGFIEKLDPIYRLSESSLDKNRRFNLDQPTVVLRLFYFQNSKDIFYILMAKKGCNGSIKNLFFEREKYKDARKKDTRICVINYEFLRINKEEYEYQKLDEDGKNSTIVSTAKQGVWTLQLSDEYKTKLKENFRSALLKRNTKQVKTCAEIITKLIGFHKVRIDYRNLKNYFEKAVIKMRLSDPKFPIKQLEDVTKLPTELRYIRPNKAVEKITVKSILKE
jgi:hypothetical protein